VTVRAGPEVCRQFEAGIGREWLVTNGLGGFASGTVTGPNTRRYHGLLVASLRPPVQRVVLLAALEEWLVAEDGSLHPLSTQEYWDGTVFPEGYRNLDEVRLEGMFPVVRWTVGGQSVEKRIWMEHGQNRTVLCYRLLRGGPVRLRLQPLFAHRDYHAHRRAGPPFDVVETPSGWQVGSGDLACSLEARDRPVVRSRPDWYLRFLHRAERERGLDAEEDLFTPGTLELPLERRSRATLVVGLEPVPAGWSAIASFRGARDRQQGLLDAAGAGRIRIAGTVRQLVLAADQFRVARHSDAAPPARSIIAGYPWFTDWGRDTMISLAGLTLPTGQLSQARMILATYMGLLDQGMLPNTFQDSGAGARYNTIDATLWLFQALAAYAAGTRDWAFVTAQLPALEDVIRWHVAGTRYEIRMDPTDGLLGGGVPGVALTWMDARVDDWVVTPRVGKPVEVNALWYNALRLMAAWRRRAGLPAEHYEEMAGRTRESALERFWYEAGGYLYDVIDGPEGNDPSLRPNQVLALGLAFPLVEGDRALRVLQAVTRDLLTPVGLRTLSPHDPRYRGQFRGGVRERDGAYHMGTVWPWLLGPYLDAHYRVHRDRRAIRAQLQPLARGLAAAGLGTIGEIFEGDPPHRAVGAIAQAWSVAEVLRHLSACSPAVGGGLRGRLVHASVRLPPEFLRIY